MTFPVPTGTIKWETLMFSDSKKVVAVSGARSEYDLLSPIYNRLVDDVRFEFQLLVTGSHLSETFGKTVEHIENDGFIIADKIYNLIDSNDRVGRVVSIGNQISGLAQSFLRLQPDFVLIAGDREEAISTTMVAAYMDIPVAHFFGGDVAKDGNIDNSVRYAASKFAHLHFPTLQEHGDNLIKLGEEAWRIFVVGNPALDKFRQAKILDKQVLSTRLGVDISQETYVVLIQHSIIDQVELQSQHIRETLEAIVSSGIMCFIIYPNSDAGFYPIVEAYEEYVAKYSRFRLFKNLERETFINMMHHASCLLGNSSSGILEAPSLGLPVINIGTRQRGRTHGNNVIFVDNDRHQISSALKKALTDQAFITLVKNSKNPYGDGYTSEKVVEILANIEIDKKLIYKNITY